MSNDQFSPSERSWIMSRVKSGNNPAELALRKVLWNRGLRYRINSRIVLGMPDILFSKAKVAVFVDGAFWHGKKLSDDRLSKMSPYWQNKLRRNMERDLLVNSQLELQGYIVVRYGERDVLRNTDTIATAIEAIVRDRSER